MKGVPPQETEVITFVGTALEFPTKVRGVVIDDAPPGKFRIKETLREGSMGAAAPGTIHRGLVDRMWWPAEESR